MQINNYQHSQNPCFGAKFINKVPDFDVDLKKAGAIFEKLTKDYPDEKLIFEKPKVWGEVGDVFSLSDKNDNKLIKAACAFSNHSEFDEANPEKQASLLDNIFRFIKERANAKFIDEEFEKKYDEIDLANPKYPRSPETIRKLQKIRELKDAHRNIEAKDLVKDAQKYNIEIEDTTADKPAFKRIYLLSQFMLK